MFCLRLFAYITVFKISIFFFLYIVLTGDTGSDYIMAYLSCFNKN